MLTLDFIFKPVVCLKMMAHCGGGISKELKSKAEKNVNMYTGSTILNQRVHNGVLLLFSDAFGLSPFGVGEYR